MKHLKTLPTVVLLGIGLLLCVIIVWPLFQPQFFHLHDFTHVTRLVELEQGITDGQLPVRWSANLGYGYGMPQFSFYGSLFYYEAYLFRLFGLSPVWSIKMAVVLQIVVSFIGLYYLGKAFWGRSGGYITAFAGTFATYRAVDMYVRGAFGELSAMTWIPLSLLALYHFVLYPTPIRLIFAAITIAGIALSHTLITLVAAPFLVLYTLFIHYYHRQFTLKRLMLSFTAGLLAFGLSAFFVIPALLEKQYTQADTLTKGFSNYNFHFLYIRQLWNSPWDYGGSIWGPEDDVSFELGKVHIIISAIAMGLASLQVLRQRRLPKSTIAIGFIFLLLLLSLFLALLKAKSLYDMFSFMAYLQFPWRYLSISIIFIALVCGSIVITLTKKSRFIVSIISILLITWSQYRFFVPEKYLEDETALYYTDPNRIQTHMSGIIPDFLPSTAKAADIPVGVGVHNKFMTQKGNVIPDINRSHEFGLYVPPGKSQPLLVKIFDFPGWQIYINGKQVNHTTTAEGLIQVDLPESEKEMYVSGKFSETPIRLTADIITAGSILFSLYLLQKRKLFYV